jgi:hypothetical protein
LIERNGKLRIGSAHRLGWLHARRLGYTRIVTLDAHLSHDPADIPGLLDAIAGADIDRVALDECWPARLCGLALVRHPLGHSSGRNNQVLVRVSGKSRRLPDEMLVVDIDLHDDDVPR